MWYLKQIIFVKLNSQHFMKVIVKSFGKSLTFIPFFCYKDEIRYSINPDILSQSEKCHKKEYILNILQKQKKWQKINIISFIWI